MTQSNLTVLDIKPFIGSKDFDKSREFYVALGWTLKYDSENLCVLELGEHRFYLQNFYAKDWCENSMLHVSVEDVNSWHTQITTIFSKHNFAGVSRHTHEIKDEGYAYTFHVWDPAGVLIHFAQHK